jgi:4a-hydroxytetrahydrobiopterin dehydratase
LKREGEDMASVLAEKACTPCRGGIPPLSRDAAEHRHERAAALAEAESHHPDVGFGWGFATISLRTKKIKALHENDFIMAAKLERIAAENPATH